MNSFNGLKNSSFLIAFVVRWHFGVLLKVAFSWEHWPTWGCGRLGGRLRYTEIALRRTAQAHGVSNS